MPSKTKPHSPDPSQMRKDSIAQAKAAQREEQEKRIAEKTAHLNQNKHLKEYSNTLKESYDELNKNYQKINKLNDELKNRNRDLEKEFEQYQLKTSPKLASCEVKEKQFNETNTQLRTKIDEKTRMNDKLQKQISDNNKKISENNHIISRHDNQLEILKVEKNTLVKRLEDNNKALESENKKLRIDIDTEQKQSKNVEQQNLTLTKEINDSKSKIQELLQEVQQKEKLSKQKDDQLVKLDNDLTRLKTENEAKLASNQTSIREINQKHESSMQALTEQLKGITQRNAEIQAENAALEAANKEKTQTIQQEKKECVDAVKQKDLALSQIQSNIDKIEAQSKDLLSYKAENEARKLEQSKYIQSLESLRDQGESCNAELLEKKKQDDITTNKIIQMQSSIDTLGKQKADLELKLSDLKAQVQSSDLSKKELLKEDESLKLQLEGMKLKSTNDQTKITELTKKISDIDTKLKETIQVKLELENRNKKLKSDYEQLTGQTQVLSSENLELQNRNKRATSNIQQLTQQTSELSSENLELQNRNKRATSSVQQLTQQTNELSSENTKLQQNIDMLNTNLQSFKSKISDLEKQLLDASSSLEKEKTSNQSEIQALRSSYESKINQQDSQLKSLQQQHSQDVNLREDQSRKYQEELSQLSTKKMDSERNLQQVKSKMEEEARLDKVKKSKDTEIIAKYDSFVNTNYETDNFDKNIDPIKLGNLLFIKNLNSENSKIKPYKYVVILEVKSESVTYISFDWTWTYQQFMISDSLESNSKEELRSAYNDGLSVVQWTWCKTKGRIPSSCSEIIPFSEHVKKWLEFSINTFVQNNIELNLRGIIYSVDVPIFGKNTGVITEKGERNKKMEYSITRRIEYIDPVSKRTTTMGQRLPNYLEILEKEYSKGNNLIENFVEKMFKQFNRPLPEQIDYDDLDVPIL